MDDYTYFLTFTVNKWIDILDKSNHFEILASSLKYCIDFKSLKLEAFVFMPSHIHLIATSPSVSSFIRDFKRYTSREILKNVRMIYPDMVSSFMLKNKPNFWQRTNMPILSNEEDDFLSIIGYIHKNPVKKGFVEYPEDWYWSSANPNCILKADTSDW